MRPPALISAISCCFLLAACPSDDGEKKAEKKEEKKAEKKADPPAEDDGAAEGGGDEGKLPELDLSGPTPPETSAVFFSVDGALIPLACFDQGSRKIETGKKCRAMVTKGEEVLLASEDGGRALDTIGDPKNALCEVADKPSSFGTSALDQGQTYDWASWPKSLGTKAEQVSAESKSDRATALSDEEKQKLLEAILAKKASAEKGELRINQKAEMDIDGDGTKEVFFSVLMAHPTSPDRSLFSGLYMAPGGSLDGLQLVERSKRDLDVLTLRGGVDLDGDGKRELWVALTFDGGSGERIVRLDGDKATALGKWTCGA
jgi:hypothetical protein